MDKSATSGVGKLDFRTRFFFGIGAAASGINVQVKNTLLLLFYNQVIGLPGTLVGMAIMIALVVDTIVDPAIGQVSDHLRSRWGRRHPFMYGSAIPLAVAFYFLWSPPVGWSEQSLFFYLLSLLIAVRLLISCYEIPSAALAPELTADYDERTRLISFRFLSQAIGGTLVLMLAYRVFLRQDASHPLGLLARDGYVQLGLVASSIMLIAILLSALGTHHRIPMLSKPSKRPEMADVMGDFKATLTNRSFMALFMSGVISAIATGVSNALGIYFLSYFWQLTPAEISYIALGGVVSAVAGVVAAGPLSRRMGKKNACVTLFALALLVAVVPLLFGLAGWVPPVHSVGRLAVVLGYIVFATSLASAGTIIVTSMLADVVEDIAVKTGRRSEGLLFAGNGLLSKSLTGFGTFVSGILLDVIHFPKAAVPGHVEPALVDRLVVFYLPIQIVLGVIAIAVIMLYRIDRATHESNLRALRDAGLNESEAATMAEEAVAPDSVTAGLVAAVPHKG